MRRTALAACAVTKLRKKIAETSDAAQKLVDTSWNGQRSIQRDAIRRVRPQSIGGTIAAVELEHAAARERQATARLIALLMEVDIRKLYAGQGYSSLFTYCVQTLHLSEHAAYLRIEAARSVRRFPTILDRLADGSLHLTAVSLLGARLAAANHVDVLDSATHKSKRDVEQLVARLRPQPDVPTVVRKLPTTNTRQTCGPVRLNRLSCRKRVQSMDREWNSVWTEFGRSAR